MKKGFTLVEIIIVLAIMAIITGSAVLSVGAGMKSAKLRDAARTVQQYTRHAKAVALLKQRPVVLLFEEVMENGEFVKSRVSISFSRDATGQGSGIGVGKNGSGASDGLTRTLSGLVVGAPEDGGDMLLPGGSEAMGDLSAGADASGTAGETRDPLMAEPREFEGVRISARLKDQEETRPRVSVFSNVDVLLRKKRKADEEAAAKEARLAGTDPQDDEGPDKPEEEHDSSFSIVYEANGRCEPFEVSVYKDGTDERDGLTVSIGRFGRTVTGD